MSASRAWASLALAASLLFAGPAGARSLAREGTVAILPAARFASQPHGTDGGAAAPVLALAFGFKSDASLEVGVDVGATFFEVERDGKSWDVLSAPLLLRFSWTPMPRLDLRPAVHLGIGKALVTVDGPDYREHTPWVVQATAGLQADLSDAVGLWIDGGYLYARAADPALGRLDAGGFLARTGVYFRWEPLPSRAL